MFSFQIFSKLILVTLLLDISIQADDIKPLTSTEYDTTTTIDLTTPQPGTVSGRRMEPMSAMSTIQKRHYFFGAPTTIQPNFNNVFQVFHNQLKQLTVTNLDAFKLLMKDLLQLFFVFKTPMTVKLAYIYQDLTYMIAVVFYSFRYLLDLYLFCLKFKGIIKGHVMFALVLVKFIPSLISTMIRSSLGMRITIG
ncbi:uncharacterized protein LOC123292835 [Chrysoperla carnea]|uniref:uncharacterized protein LOC123292835 n=1 Tax=Chrysoperla carnea TaxID=189513 RepID=UPI001D0969DA|nr:uncharacterized protein LOC123292835 [Chrysoperla carnea]